LVAKSWRPDAAVDAEDAGSMASPCSDVVTGTAAGARCTSAASTAARSERLDTCDSDHAQKGMLPKRGSSIAECGKLGDTVWFPSGWP